VGGGTLDQLKKMGAQLERFCEAYIHARSQRGIGPQRLREELRERGVAEQLGRAVSAGVAT